MVYPYFLQIEIIVRLVNYKLNKSKDIQHNLMQLKLKNIKFKFAYKLKNAKLIYIKANFT